MRGDRVPEKNKNYSFALRNEHVEIINKSIALGIKIRYFNTSRSDVVKAALLAWDRMKKEDKEKIFQEVNEKKYSKN